MNDVIQQLPQPNFVLAADSLRTAADQFRLCGNLPSVDAGAQLLTMMQTLLDSFSRLERRFDGLEKKVDSLEKRFDGLEKKVDGLEKRFDALEKRFDDSDRRTTITNQNVGARQWNLFATQSDGRLAPLFSFETGEPLDRCPSTVEELESLHAGDVDRLLRHLHESVDGRADVRKRRLKLAFGVTGRFNRV